MNEESFAHLTGKERRAIRVLVDRLNKHFPREIIQVTLFGSKARGDSSPGSDIDILIIVTEENWSLRGEVSTLSAWVSLECDVLLGPRVIGRERWERMKRNRFSLYEKIMTEGIPLVPARVSA